MKKKTTIPRSYSEDVGSHDTHADQYVKETIEDEPLTANIPAHLLPSSIEDPKHVVFGGEDKGIYRHSSWPEKLKKVQAKNS